MSRVNVIADDCDTTCLDTPGCTHFTWTSFEGGTCNTKTVLVTKADAYVKCSQDVLERVPKLPKELIDSILSVQHPGRDAPNEL